MTTPGWRFVAMWTALSAAAHGLSFALYSTPLIRGGSSMLLMAFGVAAAPIAQAIALRAAGLRWGLDWAVAGIAGTVFARAALDLLRETGVAAGGMLVYSFATVASILVLQLVVLRRHGARAAAWAVAAAALWTMQLAVSQILRGDVVPGPYTPPLSRTMLLSITTATALVEGVVLAWFVLRPMPAAAVPPRRSPGTGWLLVEWSAGGALALLAAIGTAGLVDVIFRESAHRAITLGLPVLVALAGFVIGGIQWLLLRRRLVLPKTWLAASMAALAAPAAATAVPPLATGIGYGWLMMIALPGGLAALGAWFGFCQWLVLRRHAARAFYWIPATAAAWSLYYFTAYPYNLSMETVGLAAGAIMAIAMFALRAPASGDVRLAPSIATQT